MKIVNIISELFNNNSEETKFNLELMNYLNKTFNNKENDEDYFLILTPFYKINSQ